MMKKKKKLFFNDIKECISDDDDNSNDDSDITSNFSTYTCIKTSLSSIIKPQFHSTILDAVCRMHSLTIRVTHFLKAYLLFHYSNNIQLPIVTKKLIIDIYNLV